MVGGRARVARVLGRVAVIVGVLLTTGAMTVDFDELQCEAAMAHLAECCPGFNPANHWCQQVSSCDTGRLPDLDEAESRCIVALDCTAITARHICDAVDHAPPNTWDECPVHANGCAGAGACPGREVPLYTIHAPVCQ
jgi:hypothetical protein